MRNEKDAWLPEGEWRALQQRIPVPCVDVLPVRKRDGKIEMGLIYRATPHQGRRWCLIGGRLRRNESLRAAVIRQVREALGPEVQCVLAARIQPVLVVEYFSRRARGSLFDPRQHAIGLTFAAKVRGNIQPTGGAVDFRWFTLHQLPKSKCFGFGQKKVVLDCIRRLSAQEVVTSSKAAVNGRGQKDAAGRTSHSKR